MSWPDPISINQLSQLLGRDRATLKKKLRELDHTKGPKGAYLYDLREAIEVVFAIYELENNEEGPIDPKLERAKLDRARRIDIELNTKIKSKSLIPKEVLQGVLSSLFANMKTRVLNVPTRAAQLLSGKKTQKEIKSVLDKLMKEVLIELSESSVNELIDRECQ